MAFVDRNEPWRLTGTARNPVATRQTGYGEHAGVTLSFNDGLICPSPALFTPRKKRMRGKHHGGNLQR